MDQLRWGPFRCASALLVSLLGAFAACDETLNATPASAVVDGGGDAPTQDAQPDVADANASSDIAFNACPGAYSGACAEVMVPLDWSKPDGKKISIFVDKIATSPKATKQLWLLQGGPGGPGADMVPMALQIAAQRSDVDIYTLDHRGVGRSARLGCANEPQPPDLTAEDGGAIDAAVDASDAGADDAADTGVADAASVVPSSDRALAEWEPCLESAIAEWGDDLAQFNTTNAARDLAHVIDRLKDDSKQVFVYGVSYGTYWAHRYVQIAPTQATGVVLDSILAPDGEFISTFDLHFDLVAKKVADLCKADATCSAKLGADPWTTVQNIMAKVGTGHCPEFPIPRAQRAMFSQMWTQRDLHPLALAALHRYDRCSSEDVEALKAMRSKLQNMRPPTAALFSRILYFNVAFSELWETPAPSLAVLHARNETAVFPAAIEEMFALQARWPKYPADSLVRAFATSPVPMLMMNGTFDAQTPIETASLIADKIKGPHQTFVAIPTASHTTLFQSPVKTQGKPSCGMQVMMSFMDDPLGTPNQSCLNDIAPISFEPKGIGNVFFGTPDIWTGAATGGEQPDWMNDFRFAPPRYPTFTSRR